MNSKYSLELTKESHVTFASINQAEETKFFPSQNHQIYRGKKRQIEIKLLTQLTTAIRKPIVHDSSFKFNLH